MYSSRMRTARLLPVSPSIHCSQGGIPALGVYLPGGVTAQGVGVYLLGVYLPGRGVPAQGGVPAWGGCTCLGVYLPRYSPVNRMTDRQV